MKALQRGGLPRKVRPHPSAASHAGRREVFLIRASSQACRPRPVVRRLPALVCIGIVFGATASAPRTGTAQESGGSDGATLAGAALGIYAGAALGGLSSIIPCNQTMAGIRCVRAVTALGGGIGLAVGATLGREDEDAVWDAYRRSGFGFAAGAVVVLALEPFVDKWSWADVAAGGVIGSAIAAGGSGAWIGLVAGTGIGVGLWQLVPSVEMPDAIALGLAGMAVGGFTSWIVKAIDAGDDAAASDLPVLQFDVAVPW